MFLVIPSYPNYSACTTANQDFKDTLVGGACHQTGVDIPKSPCNNGHNYCVCHRNTRRNTQKQSSVFVIMSKMVRKLFKHLSFATKNCEVMERQNWPNRCSFFITMQYQMLNWRSTPLDLLGILLISATVFEITIPPNFMTCWYKNTISI